MRLKNGFVCMLSALMICAAVGCGRRTDSGDKPEVKGGEHVKSGIQSQKAPVLTGSSEVYSVMDFGAVGNGRADDTRQYRMQLIMQLPRGEGQFISQKGKYKINETIRISARVPVRLRWQEIRTVCGKRSFSLDRLSAAICLLLRDRMYIFLI